MLETGERSKVSRRNSAARIARWACIILLSITASAEASLRGIRIDFAGDWGDSSVDLQIGSADCPGTAATDTLVLRLGQVFSGDSDPAYHFDVDTYCQKTAPYVDDFTPYFSKNSFFSDEQALGYLVGDNKNNAVSGIRYTYLSGPRFSSPNGFQWAYYQFPYGLTLVGLYGLTAITLSDTYSYISGSQGRIWGGASDGYNGEYFCFETTATGTAYIGKWDGNLAATGNLCLQKAARIYVDSFEN